MHILNIRVTQQGSKLLVTAWKTAQVTPIITSWVLNCFLKSTENMFLQLVYIAGVQIQKVLVFAQKRNHLKDVPQNV